MRILHQLITVPVATAFLTIGLASAQEKSADEIAKELANPNTPLASLNFKNQFRLFDGDLPNAGDQWSYNLVFQPSLPFALDSGNLLLFRPAIPFLAEQPFFDSGDLDFAGETALGDISFDLALANTSDTGILTAFGIISTLPTSTSSILGSGRWSIGPEFLVGKITPDYVLGVFPNHQWDVAGWSDKTVNVTSTQVFATLLPGGGWNVGTSPTFSYDWEAEQWTVPLNLSVGKTVIMGDTPWKISAELNYYLEKPDAFGPEWMFGINFAPVVKNPLAKLFGN